ncbi:hypothetical protein WDZ17_16080 [Pseudokineococcus basanitobsidens]|uniref:Uncharacterized protein n=1 Tax=Pseudokineococcus basanitobsidens TaxID=1926649 RepID=A0ABU8RPB7_9ACTN
MLVATGSLYEGSSTYYWLCEDGVVEVSADGVDEATVLALLASAEPVTREELVARDR